jgi:hypothetical protein
VDAETLWIDIDVSWVPASAGMTEVGRLAAAT